MFIEHLFRLIIAKAHGINFGPHINNLHLGPKFLKT